MDTAPTTLPALLAQVERDLAALATYLVQHKARPEVLGVVRAMQWTVAGSLRVALGLRSGIDDARLPSSCTDGPSEPVFPLTRDTARG